MSFSFESNQLIPSKSTKSLWKNSVTYIHGCTQRKVMNTEYSKSKSNQSIPQTYWNPLSLCLTWKRVGVKLVCKFLKGKLLKETCWPRMSSPVRANCDMLNYWGSSAVCTYDNWDQAEHSYKKMLSWTFPSY